jgi:L,D-transpeptidase ErfK/SrfK
MNRITYYFASALLVASAAMLPLPAAAQSKEQSKRTSVKNLTVLNKLESQRAALPIRPMAGQYEKIKVEKTRGLFDLARENNVSLTELRRVNKLSGTRVKAGKSLLLPTLHVLPRNPANGVVLNVPERAIYVFKESRLVARYPVAVGQSSWQTALGEFSIRKKLKNPPWKPTKEMVEREGISDEIVPPGPRNPLGDRWIGWTEPGFGFHGTISPRSIGTAASHGCVRLYPEAVHKLFEEVTVGMPIYSVYEPVLLGEMDGRLYLSVFPDIYHTGLGTLAHVKKELDAAGVADLVDPAALKQIVGAADGYPHRIVGSDEPLTVNGAPIKAALKPTRVKGQWIVPLREVAQALGGRVGVANGAITVTGGGRTLTLRPGDRTAEIDHNPVNLEVAPTVIHGTTLAPLGLLTEALGARVAFEKGIGVEVTSVTAGASPGSGATPAAPQQKTPAFPTRRL